jgi:hypothetical protein
MLDNILSRNLLNLSPVLINTFVLLWELLLRYFVKRRNNLKAYIVKL